MTLADTVFRPFETLLRPLDLPVRPMPDAGPLHVVWHFVSMFRRVLVLVGTLSVLSAGIGLVVVWALARIVDGVVAEGPLAFLDAHGAALAAFAVLIGVVRPALAFVEETVQFQSAGVLLPAAMRWQAHKAVEGQDLAFFEDTFAGQVASRIAQVVDSVQRQMMLAIDLVPQVAVQFVGATALLAAMAWPLAIPVACWILANALLAWKVVPVYIERSSRVAEVESRSVGTMTDIYGNIATVKLFAAEDSEADAVRAVIGETIDARHRENRYYTVSNTLVIALNAALLLGVFAAGLWGMTRDLVSVGEFAAAVAITGQLSPMAFAFIAFGQQFARTIGTLEDAMPILTRRPGISDREGATPLVVSGGRIDFDAVRFGYARGETGDEASSTPVVEDFSLHVEAGERVGIVGLSGVGKSTLLALLLRLREVEGGSIRIDGADVRDVTQASLRERIGVVTQDVALFNRSVRDNIRYGSRRVPTTAAIERAVALAEADGFVRRAFATRRGAGAWTPTWAIAA